MKNWKAYISYCSEEQKNEYNLKDNEHIQCINVFEDMNDPNINYLNHFYSELVMCYYVWKNQLYSDYVCIWDHRRFITPINFDKLDNNCIQAYYHIHTDVTPFEYMIRDGINEYIIWQFVKYMIEEKHIDHDFVINTIFNEPWNDGLWLHSCFNCNWYVFNDMCDFMFNFTNYMIPNGDYTNWNSLEQFNKDMKLSIDILKPKYKDGEIIDFGRIQGEDRIIGNVYELIFPLYCKFMGYESFSEVEDKHIAIELYNYNKDTIKNDIRKLIGKNIFTGCRDFAIITNEDKYDELKELTDNHWYELSNANVAVILDKDTELLSNYIILNDSIYIDSDSPNNTINKNNIKQFK